MAGGEVYFEKLRPPEVADCLIRGSTFIKWDDDCTSGQKCVVKVDPAGHLIYWKAEDKETDFLEFTSIRDIRTGKWARIPKDPKLRDSVRFGGPEEELPNKTITIVHGSNMVDLVYISFVSGSVAVAQQWTSALMNLTHNLLAINACPSTFLQKHYTKICVQPNPEGKILVKNIIKHITSSSKEDRKRVQEALQSVGLPHGKNDIVSPDEFTFETFLEFYNRLCNRQDIDKIFTEIAKKKPYLTTEQVVDFINNNQRDPRLNEILFPYCNPEKAQELINRYEPKKDFVKKGHFSVQGFTRYLMSYDNTIINPDRLSLHQDMTQSLAHYFINSSHNTYLTGHQLTGKSSVEMYRQTLLIGCRCVELDCWDGRTEQQEPVITHGMTLCTEILFKDVIEAIAECAFKTSDYPVILSFENHCTPKQQSKMAAYCVTIFGDMLLDKPLEEFPLEEGKPLPTLKSLMRKIIIKNKKRPIKRDESNDTESVPPTPTDASSNPPLPESNNINTEEKIIIETENNDSTKDQEEDESAPETSLSELVNYIQPVHFKSFETSAARNCSFEMSSFVETSATVLLKEKPVEFVNYNKRQLSRIYPRGTRVGSENYMPQIFWNAGCQLVALNFQTLDLAMMLNLGIFEYNGRSGYLQKPSFMRRPDRTFDPFAESTVDGIIAGAVSVKVISGQMLTDKKVGTYVEVEMYGLPADTVRKKYRTKVVPSNGINPVYDEDPFDFKKVVLPSLAVLRIVVYEESGKLIGQRVLPVDGLHPGYRHIKLRNECNQPLCLPTLFVNIITKDYVPDGFEDFAAALCDPIAYQSQYEKRQQQLASLMDEEEEEVDGDEVFESSNGNDIRKNSSTPKSPNPDKEFKSRNVSFKRPIEPRADSLKTATDVILSQRRGSAISAFAHRESLREAFPPTMKPQLQHQVSSPFPQTGRTQSLQTPPPEATAIYKRSVSVKKREGKTTSMIITSEADQKVYKHRPRSSSRLASLRKPKNDEELSWNHIYVKVEAMSIEQLKEQKSYVKLLQRRQKDHDMLVKKHEKEKDKLQKSHFVDQDKLFKDLVKEKATLKKAVEKELRKAEKKGSYEEAYKSGMDEINSLTKEHDNQVDALKRKHRDEMLSLLKRQLEEQLANAKKQIDPQYEELKRVMIQTNEDQIKLLDDIHAKQINDLKKDQDKLNREELKFLSRNTKEKDELQRRKREQNKKHIEQSVKERHKMKDFHDKEKEELIEEQGKIEDVLIADKEKTIKELDSLFEKKISSIPTSELESFHANLFAGVSISSF